MKKSTLTTIVTTREYDICEIEDMIKSYLEINNVVIGIDWDVSSGCDLRGCKITTKTEERK
jgi:hypothetical protein